MRVGDTLKNGSTVIASRVDGKGAHILCLFRGEYATWYCDETGDCYGGKYFRTLRNAVSDFEGES